MRLPTLRVAGRQLDEESLDRRACRSCEDRATKRNILVVDDSVSTPRVTTLALSDAGYDTLVAIDGEDGYNTAIISPIRAVLVSVNLPGMSGAAFIRKFRAHPSSVGVPIILLAEESDDALKLRAKEACIAAWNIKPFRESELLTSIKRVLACLQRGHPRSDRGRLRQARVVLLHDPGKVDGRA